MLPAAQLPLATTDRNHVSRIKLEVCSFLQSSNKVCSYCIVLHSLLCDTPCCTTAYHTQGASNHFTPCINTEVPLQLDESTQVKQGEAEAAFKDKAVLPFMKKLPIKRVVHLPNITADPIKFSLQYNTSQGSPLPPGVASAEMAHFVVTGVDSTLSKYHTTGKRHPFHHSLLPWLKEMLAWTQLSIGNPSKLQHDRCLTVCRTF